MLAIENFLDTDETEELAHWRDDIDAAVRERLESKGAMNNQHHPDTLYVQVFTQCSRLAAAPEGRPELMFAPCLERRSTMFDHSI